MLSSCTRSTPFFLLLLPLLLCSISFAHGSSLQLRFPHSITHEVFDEGENGEVVNFNIRRSVAETVSNSSLILAQERTTRRDPSDNFNFYTGGWNISNAHYWLSVAFTAVPLFVIAAVWFVVFGLSLCLICLCYCCCRRERYGYSRFAYALSLILLILFTISAIVGSIVLYTGEGKFHGSTSDTLKYIVAEAEGTLDNLRNVSDYLSAAKKMGVDSVFLSADVQNKIDDVQSTINSTVNLLDDQIRNNSKKIQKLFNTVGLTLVIVAAAMLILAFLGFFFSVIGLQCLVNTLVMIGWFLVTGTFILCGVFLLLHNVVGDTCVAMEDWVQHPTDHTALDDILPCVEKATAEKTLLRTKEVTYALVNVVNGVITNVSNVNFPPVAGPLYYNQSGPLMPILCNPFNSDQTDRKCGAGEVDLGSASQAWSKYVCQVSASGICTTPGRVTPKIYDQMTGSANVSYGLYHFGPFLVDLVDCTFVRDTFNDISINHCPGLLNYGYMIVIGLAMVSVAVMLSLIFWVIYARERRHRVFTKQFMARPEF